MKIFAILVFSLNIAVISPVEIYPFKVYNVTNKPTVGGQSRIFNGHAAPQGKFKYMIFALMVFNKRFNRCSASLISPKRVLLAAHCVGPPYPDHTFLVGGQTDLTYYVALRLETPYAQDLAVDDIDAQERRAIAVISHPKYNSKSYEHDIGIAFLGKPFTYNLISTISLSYVKMKKPMSCTIVGWGSTGEDENNFQLHYVEKKTYKTVELGCKHKKKGPFLCSLQENSGACRGDTGSPLICDDKVWGVASHFASLNKECGEGLEEYYAEIYPDIKWIMGNRGGNLSAVTSLKITFLLNCLWLYLTSSVSIIKI